MVGDAEPRVAPGEGEREDFHVSPGPGAPGRGRKGVLRAPVRPAKFRVMAEPVHHIEDVVVKAGGAVLRYGGFYGPGGGIEDQIELVRKRRLPIIGGGTGYFSWVHLDDAASATVLAVEQRANGVFNIVDDEPGLAAVAGEPLRERANLVLLRAYLAEGNAGESAEEGSRASTFAERS